MARCTKEIGIRKVLGASAVGVVFLFSREFVLLIGVANGVAWPIAYLATQQWLQQFVYRIQPGAGIFLAGAAALLGVVLLTVGVQVVKAALVNPVEALRYE